MGLTIHYSGSINDTATLPALIEEVQDIAKIFQWNYHIYETEFPTDAANNKRDDGEIYGISISPPECEPVWFCFLSNKRMCSPVNVTCFANSDRDDYKEYLYMLATKTQFAGAEIHQQVIHLMKYISEKYLDAFKVIDEGQYWETTDKKLLLETFEKYTNLLNQFTKNLEQHTLRPGESLESFFERILKKYKDGEDNQD